ncbi:MAG: hypothetical protein JRN62_03550 [Nitrososphaerota archaeon]|jgi:hypothetical protein|nr:hypothetical protein [Nitrososphaerota archaeon]MDG6948676.1 hypothetical protein [Nitrososphaerota archaeon]
MSNTDVVIQEVPHREQRYPTVGDWIPPTKTRPAKIRASRMKDRRYTFLVALHEFIEYRLCKEEGITDEVVVDFDVQFEEERKAGLHGKYEEPGDDPRAPYRAQHKFATRVERMTAKELGISWRAYERTVNSLGIRKKKHTSKRKAIKK